MADHPVIKHKFASPVTDTGDTNRIQPSGWNAEHDVDLGAALMALFALSPAADRLPYFTAAGAAALATFTAPARTLLAGSSLSAMLTALGGIAKAGDTMGGALTLAGDPTIGLHAATKQYVDNSVAGLDPKPSAKYATAAALAANAYAAGVLTASANGALAVDGAAPIVGDRILVKNEAAAANNGIYVVTATGDASHPYVLTRAADMATWGQVPGATLIVEQGAANADTGWLCTSDAAGTLGTTAIAFAEWFGTGIFQPHTANLDALAGLTGAANKVPYFTALATMALLTIGTGPSNLVQLDGSSRLPAVDGSQLTNVISTPVIPNYLTGLDISVTTNTFTIAKGAAADSTNTRMMSLASALTKTQGAWAAGNGNGALDNGTIAGGTWYHVHEIMRTDLSAVDGLLSLSATAPTMPAGYTYFRRIGSLAVDSSGSKFFIQRIQNGAKVTWVPVAANMVAAIANPGTTPFLQAVLTPPGVACDVVLSVCAGCTANGNTDQPAAVYISCPDVAAAPNLGTGGLATIEVFNSSNIPSFGGGVTTVMSNVNQQVRVQLAQSGATTAVSINPVAYYDRRGQ